MVRSRMRRRGDTNGDKRTQEWLVSFLAVICSAAPAYTGHTACIETGAHVEREGLCREAGDGGGGVWAPACGVNEGGCPRATLFHAAKVD